LADTWRVEVDGGSVSARVDRAAKSRGAVVFAHGAGGNMNDRGVQRSAATLCETGLDVVRFNFPYSEHGSRRPDLMPRLMSTIVAVVAYTRHELSPAALIIGGRSMGGRAASMLAAEQFACDGLLLLAYPLHPPGQHDNLRDAHLPKIRVPVLCVNGTRDAFCDYALMERVLERVSTGWTMHWVKDADHSFHVRRSSGRTDAEVFQEIGDVASRWLDALGRSA
jgi:uncharacterized protein